MTYFVSFFIAFVALLASLSLYRQGPSDVYLRLFPPFLFIVTVLLGIMGYLAYKALSDIALLNALTIFQCCFYFFLLYRIIPQPVVRVIAKHLIWVYPLIAVINIFFVQKMESFHSVTYSLGGLLVVGLCIFYFFGLFQRPQAIILTRNPDFWICSGLLFYFSTTFPIYGMANNFYRLPVFIRLNLNAIFNVLDVLLYTSFSIAFLCRLKIRKSL